MEKPWLEFYPENVNHNIDQEQVTSIGDIFAKSVLKYGDKVAYENFGATMSFKELDKLSNDFASYLTHVLKLKKGDRIAIQLPNLLQYPIALFGALKAGLIVVNTNPLYTEHDAVVASSLFRVARAGQFKISAYGLNAFNEPLTQAYRALAQHAHIHIIPNIERCG